MSKPDVVADWTHFSDETKLVLYQQTRESLESANVAVKRMNEMHEIAHRSFLHIPENYEAFQPYGAHAKQAIEAMVKVVNQLGKCRKDHPERFEHLQEEEIFHGAVIHELQSFYNKDLSKPNVVIAAFDMFKRPMPSEMAEYVQVDAQGNPTGKVVKLHKRRKREYRPNSDDKEDEEKRAKRLLESKGLEPTNDNMVKLGFPPTLLKFVKRSGGSTELPKWVSTTTPHSSAAEKHADLDQAAASLQRADVKPTKANLANYTSVSKAVLDAYFAPMVKFENRSGGTTEIPKWVSTTTPRSNAAEKHAELDQATESLHRANVNPTRANLESYTSVSKARLDAYFAESPESPRKKSKSTPSSPETLKTKKTKPTPSAVKSPHDVEIRGVKPPTDDADDEATEVTDDEVGKSK